MQKLFLVLLIACGLSARGAEIKFDFGTLPSDQPPAGFHSALAGGGKPGEWKTITEEVTPLLAPLTPQAPKVTSRVVLAQTSEDMTDERFPMLVYDGETFANFTLTTRFKIVSGVAEQMAGVVFRFQNASNFYVIRASALGHNLRFYKVVDGVRGNPIGPTLDVSPGAWHTLTVQCQANQISCWLDQQLVMPPLIDNTFPVGKVGFWTKSDAVTYFSDAAITYTPRIPMAQVVVDDILKKQPRILGLRIYTLDGKDWPRIIASKDRNEIGQIGTDAESAAITGGTISYGTGNGTVAVTMPFSDRNGDPMAAMRVQLKSFLGETQDNAITRARMILKKMQAQISSREELLQ